MSSFRRQVWEGKRAIRHHLSGLCVGALLVALWGCGGSVVTTGSSTGNGGGGTTSGVGASNTGSTGPGTGGASPNECAELANALLAASNGNGCSALATAAMTYAAETQNCPAAAVDQNLVNCYVTCLKQLTDCTSVTVTSAYATCVGGCKP
jgi:hypothetical protein